MNRFPPHLPICCVTRDRSDGSRRQLETLADRVRARNIRVAVIGAGVLYRAPEEAYHTIDEAVITADLVLVDGPVAWANGRLQMGGDPPIGGERSSFYYMTSHDLESCACAIIDWLAELLKMTPVHGCILIGGKSTRMGYPKHLLTTDDGRTWLECGLARLHPFVDRCVVAGSGELPDACGGLERIDDLVEVAGPLAGIGAVVGQPWISWLVLACDMPDVSAAAIDWLLDQRRPGIVAVIPVNTITGRSEPLFAWYDFRCAPLLASLRAAGSLRMRDLAGREGVLQPRVPVELAGAWRNVNRPEER